MDSDSIMVGMPVVYAYAASTPAKVISAPRHDERGNLVCGVELTGYTRAVPVYRATVLVEHLRPAAS